MGIIATKSGKIIKAAGIGVLLMMSVLTAIQAHSSNQKRMNTLTCDGDDTDTIIVAPDRLRSRLLLDIFKKLTFLPSPLGHVSRIVCDLKLHERKLLFVNAYQRNVFYVFTFSTVP